MKKHYDIYKANNGIKYIQTYDKYLAGGLSFCGFRYKVFTKENKTTYSFIYSEKLLQVIQFMHEVKANA